MALGDFYGDIASSADEFAECYMGVFGKLSTNDFPAIRLSTAEPITQLSDLRIWIAQNREECCGAYSEQGDKDGKKAESNDVDCTELANLIDNILAVIDRALYRLKFLK